MTQQMNTENRKKGRGWIVALVLLLILAGGVGYLYYSVVKAPLELDDPKALVSSAPMDASERFRISAEDRTVQVKMDKADLWHLIFRLAGDDFLEKINGELASYDLTVSGCAIGIGEAGVRLDLELLYRDIRLVAKVPCDLQISGRQFVMTPTAVKLGAIPLPVGKLLSNVKLEYELDLPVVCGVSQVQFEEGAILLTGSIEEDIRSLAPLNEKFYQIAMFSGEQQPLVDALQSDAGISVLMDYLEKEPAALEALYRQLFLIAGGEKTENYLESRRGMTRRFLPGIDFAALAQEQQTLAEDVNSRNLVLEQFFTNLVNDYNDKKFKLSDGVFILNWKPFDVVKYVSGKYESLFETLDPESVFLILVDAEDGFIRKTSSFYRMADENQQFTQEVDYNKTYILGCVIRSVDGDPFLLYESEVETNNTYSRVIKLQPLTEKDVSSLQVEGKFGVWTGK